MKFLFVLHNFLPERLFGAETVCIQQMSALLRRGCSVALFYAGNADVSRRDLRKYGLEDLRLYRAGYLDTRAQTLLSIRKPHVSRRFRSCLDDFAADIAVFHHLVRLSLDLPAIAKGRGIPTVYWLHDFYPVCPAYSLIRADESFCRPEREAPCAACLMEKRFSRLPASLSRATGAAFAPLMRFRRQWIRRLSDSVDMFVSPSRFLPSELKRRGFSLSACRIIPNGVSSIPPFETIPSNRVRFGYMGNVIPKKGIGVLAEAFRGRLGESLTIRGFADERQILRFRATYPDFGARLELFSDDRDGFYRGIDVLIVPSLWPENQPMVVLEALARGIPVVCSRIGGLPEMVRHGEWGICFEPGNADELRRHSIRLSENPQSVREMIENIPVWPSTEEAVDDFLEAAKSLCGKVLTKS